jgi:hypothetical protein
VTKAEKDEPRNGYEKVGGTLRRPNAGRLFISKVLRRVDYPRVSLRSIRQARQSEALQERFRRRKVQPTVGASEFLHKFESSKFHNEPTLVGVEEPIDFCLADRLPERDAGKHFERGGGETRDAVATVLFTQRTRSLQVGTYSVEAQCRQVGDRSNSKDFQKSQMQERR